MAKNLIISLFRSNLGKAKLEQIVRDIWPDFRNKYPSITIGDPIQIPSKEARRVIRHVKPDKVYDYFSKEKYGEPFKKGFSILILTPFAKCLHAKFSGQENDLVVITDLIPLVETFADDLSKGYASLIVGAVEPPSERTRYAIVSTVYRKWFEEEVAYRSIVRTTRHEVGHLAGLPDHESGSDKVCAMSAWREEYPSEREVQFCRECRKNLMKGV